MADPAPQTTVFVSYNKADRVWAEWIAWELEEAEYKTTIQAWDFGAGSNFVLEMQEAAAKCERTIAVLSEHYLASEFTAPEWAAAFARDPTGKNRKFVPVRVQPCKPEGLLGPIVYIDLLNLDEAAARKKLLDDFKPGRKKPATPPAFPGAAPAPASAVTATVPKPPFPPTLPRHWNVPARNPLFTGRQEILENLHRHLTQNRRAVLSGIGGMGKTQTAIEFAHRHRRDYESVFFLRADTETNLIAGMVEMASLLGLPESSGSDQQAAMTAARRWLQEKSGWLLLADNADDISLARRFLPTADAPGSLLLTTQATATAMVAPPTKVPKMLPDDGARLLLRRAGILIGDAPLSSASASDQAEARALNEELGGLPLALDQAGAYMEETQTTPGEYLRLYKDEARAATLRNAQRPDVPHEHINVTATFSLAFGKVEAANPAAADLLRLCAFLASDDIPESIFAEGAPELGERLAIAADEMKRNEMIREVARFSLLQRDTAAKTLSIHREAQAVLRDGMTAEEWANWAERAVRVMHYAFPDPGQFSNWSGCAALLPHALSCANRILSNEMESVALAFLLDSAAVYLNSQARYAEAEPLLGRALAIREKALGANHPDTALSLNNLAALYANQGKLAEAEPFYRRALAIWEKALGADHPDTATSLNNLAALYVNQGKLAEAEPLLGRALAIREKALGANHPDTALSLNNLAALYVNQGKLAEAEPFHRRALAIREKTLGADHPDTAQSLNNLALLYANQGKLAEAEPLLRRALAICEKTLGADHPDTAQNLNNLAALYANQGKLAEAEPLLRRALAICEKTLGADHPDTAQNLNNLAALYANQGKLAEAEPLLRRALPICEKTLGADHPDTAQSLHNLAAFYEQQGLTSEAELLYRRALAIYEAAHPYDHPHVANELEAIASICQRTDRENEAKAFFDRAKRIREAIAQRESGTAQAP